MDDVKETGRIEAFSDGVLAVAITLLVLELKVPSPDRSIGSDLDLMNQLLAQWPTLGAFLISFATIGIMWINHHRLFLHIQRVDTGLQIFNLLLLLIIVFIPVPTDLLSVYIGHAGERVAIIMYTGTFFLMATVFNILWLYAARNGRLLGKNSDIHSVRAISRQYVFGPVLYGIIFIVGWFSTPIALGLSFVLALFFALPGNTFR